MTFVFKHFPAISVGMAVAVAWPTAAWSGELRLTNGDRITGEPVGIENDHLLFNTGPGSTLRVSLSSVRSLTSASPVAVTLAGGDRIVGVLHWDGTNVQLGSTRFGDLTLTPSEIGDIRSEQALPAVPLADAELLRSGRGTGTRPAPQLAQASQDDEAAGSPGTIGRPPPEEAAPDIRRIFLRESTVLLNPGEVDVELSLLYARDETGPEASRDLRVAPSVRFGILDRLEGFVDVSAGYADREIVTPGGIIEGDTTGIGDTSFGLKYLLVPEDALWPDVVLTGTVVAPTGKEPDPFDPREVALGGGRWRTSAGVTLIRSYDPAVVFGSVGYTHSFDDTISGVEIEGGHSFSYSFGAGFAINNQISLSGQFFGAYQTKISLDGRTVEGSTREPMALRSSLTYRMAEGSYLEPAVTYGLNDSAGDVVLQLSYSQRL